MREVFSQLGIGIRAYGRAFSFIFKHRLGWYFVFPLAFIVLLLLGGAALVTQAAAWVQEWVWGTLDVDNWEFFLSGALADVKRFHIWAVFKVLLYFFMAFFGGAIVLIMMSPVLAHLSEKTEKILTGTDYPFSVDQLVRDIFRGVLIALRNALIGFG
ncbi:MAG: EI24 domain-containing protein, partial [Bacteroidota bacterium]